VQYLYEQTVVPVREIARLLGVSERTLYKYVARHGWQRRHVCIAREDAVRAANRGRILAPRDGFGCARGAGGRFITCEERGTPQPRGPKALDPLAAEAIGGRCDDAAIASNVAVSEVIAAAAIDDANAQAARVALNSARTVAEAARILRQLCNIALANDERKKTAQAAPAPRAAEQEQRTAELRAEIARKLEAVVAAGDERAQRPAGPVWMRGGPEALAWLEGKTGRPSDGPDRDGQA
jgi:hypothetical protein